MSLEFDIDITRTDTGWGTVDVNGERFQFVAVDGQFYINADAPFWTALGASAAESPLLANKWVTAPSQLAPQIQAAVAFSKVAGDLSNAPAGLSKAGRAAAPDGRQGIKLSAGEDVIYVSMTAPVCPIYVHAGVDSGGPSDLAFSNFNAPVVVTPPPNPVDGAGLFGA